GPDGLRGSGRWTGGTAPICRTDLSAGLRSRGILRAKVCWCKTVPVTRGRPSLCERRRKAFGASACRNGPGGKLCRVGGASHPRKQAALLWGRRRPSCGGAKRFV